MSESCNFSGFSKCTMTKEELRREINQVTNQNDNQTLRNFNSFKKKCNSFWYACQSRCEGLSDKSPNWATSSPKVNCGADCLMARDKCYEGFSSCRKLCDSIEFACESQCAGLSDKEPNWASDSPKTECGGNCFMARDKCYDSCK
jgi:hypothetical protein